MPLSIQTREKSGVVVLELSGRIVAGEECESLRRKTKELLASNQTKILQNFKDVAYIDSTGIGALVEAVILTAKAGGTLKLVNVPRLVYNILHTHRLLQAFEVYENEEEALTSFSK